MMLGLGPDFIAARRGETYLARNGQWWLWVVLLLALQVAVLAFMQTIFGLLVYVGLYGNPASLAGGGVDAARSFTKAMLVGMTPAAILTAMFCWWSAGWANATGERGIPLHRPRLGMAGWLLTAGGLVVSMWCLFILAFTILGIDPATYAPTGEGSQSGLVEKAMADLANEPLLFALALPGVTLAVPLVEEIMFRGAFFAMMRKSWFGATGAVVLSAAIWALVHGSAAPWLFVGLIFIMGLLLGLLLLRFGSLWVTIVCHAVWNTFSSLAIFGTMTGS